MPRTSLLGRFMREFALAGDARDVSA